MFFSLYAEIVEVEIEVVSPSIVPSGNFAELNRTVTCMVLKANDRRTSCPCHDEFRGPRSDYVRQVALENNHNNDDNKLFIKNNSTSNFRHFDFHFRLFHPDWLKFIESDNLKEILSFTVRFHSD
ncbi:hypothetical protein TNCV_1302671 [Trichonephila clavipes]|nr:hypothetical protein TNCV_1302671 [Trichonephila clavipes]